jgi:hypothetical protein
MKCPSFETLVSYLEGEAGRPATGEIGVHLSRCDNCGGNRHWYQAVKSLAVTDDSIAPPGWVFKRAMKSFKDWVPPAGALINLAQKAGRVVAQLVFDSGVQPMLAGARSSAVERRQVLYRADEFSIDLQIEPREQSRAGLAGQILREGDCEFESVAGRSLTLVRDGTEVATTRTNARGEFAITSLDSGSYDLAIDTGELDITIVGLGVN